MCNGEKWVTVLGFLMLYLVCLKMGEKPRSDIHDDGPYDDTGEP